MHPADENRAVGVEVLERVELFRPIPPAGLARLAERGVSRRFAAGEVLMRQDEPSQTMFVILEGRVRVERAMEDGRTVPLAELGPGDVVGEMGLLDAAPRSATVTALEDARVLEIHATVLKVVLIEHPAVSTTLLRILSRRLRSTDELVEEMSREQSERLI